MRKGFVRNTLLVLFGLSFTLQSHAEGLRCFAGLQSDKEKNQFNSEKKPDDFTTSEDSVIQYGKTYSVRKYRTEVENFIVEGIVFLNSGVAAELSITDRTTGVVARIKEQGQVRLNMSSPRESGLTNVAAACTQD